MKKYSPFKMNPKSPLLQSVKMKKVKTQDPKTGKTYYMGVKEGTGYDKLAQKLGSVPANLRNISVGPGTDPFEYGISKEESKKRRKAYSAKKNK